MMPARTVYIIYHVPKTGGTSLRAHLRTHLQVDVDFINLGPHAIRTSLAQGKLPLEQRSKEELQAVRVIHGHGARYGMHSLFPDARCSYLTFVRDPADQTVSRYNFALRKVPETQDLDFQTWFLRSSRNPQVVNLYEFFRFPCPRLPIPLKYLIVRFALSRLDHVGITEDLDADMAPVLEDLGIPVKMERRNTATQKAKGRRFRASDEWREKIYAAHRWDTRLYDFVRSRIATRNA